MAHRVILVHGIRDSADWYHKVRETFETPGSDLKVEPVEYGYFNLIQFLIPGPTRWLAERHVARQIERIFQRYRDDDISIIAFSFGTHVVARTLLGNPTLKVRNLILCGAVASRRFDWASIRDRVSGHLINECGASDPWPLIAETVTLGFSRSGTYGINRDSVYERKHDAAHTPEMLTDGTPIREEWKRILSGEMAPTPQNKGERPFWFRLLSPTLVRTLAVGGALALMFPLYEPGAEALTGRCLRDCGDITMSVTRVLDYRGAVCRDGERQDYGLMLETYRFSRFVERHTVYWEGGAGSPPAAVLDLATFTPAVQNQNDCESCSETQYNIDVNGREARLAWQTGGRMARTVRFVSRTRPVTRATIVANWPAGVTLVGANQSPIGSRQDACSPEDGGVVCDFGDEPLQPGESIFVQFSTTEWACPSAMMRAEGVGG